jgi:hypothetical protein
VVRVGGKHPRVVSQTTVQYTSSHRPHVRCQGEVDVLVIFSENKILILERVPNDEAQHVECEAKHRQ